VGDEAVHKELGDRMERVATTASSLEAEQDSATIDKKVKITVFEGSIRRHLKLEDSEGIPSLPTAEIFEQLALMGYVTTSDSLTFQKGHFSPRWKFFIHTILHCLSPKKTAWKQFSSNIATAIICLGEEPSIQTTPETSPSKITSSPSLSSHHTSISSPSTSQPLITPTKEAAPMPHESPLHSVHSCRRDKGMKKLEKTVKTSKVRRRARIVLSEDENATEDSSKQGRKISNIDIDPTISLVQSQQDMEYDFDVSTAEGFTTASTSTVSPPRVSTAEDISGAETLVYIRRSASKEKDKGKAIMQESEPPKKIKKRVQVQMSIDEELTKKVFEEEQARFNAEQEARFKAEQEQERIDFETALELQKKLDEREEVPAKEVHDIDWSDPSVLRYHALQNRPFSVAEVRKNMCMYLKNQGGYKMSHFKGMSYEEIRPIFERVWDQIQSFVPMDSEKEKGSEKKTRGRRKKSLARKRAKETLSEESAKKQKLEDDAEKEELQVYLNIVPEEESLDVESLATKYPIVDWETQILANDKYYYQIKRADGSVKHYKIFSVMLYDFDRQDVLELVHVILMDTGLVIHMMVEKKYPLSQDTLSKMLSKRLEVDHQSEMGYELIRRKISTASTNLILLEDLVLPEKINNAKGSQRLSEDKDYLEMKIRR
ncbi:hypothetical protein Tco_0698866, partial [Tanacetum coccineum]